MSIKLPKSKDSENTTSSNITATESNTERKAHFYAEQRQQKSDRRVNQDRRLSFRFEPGRRSGTDRRAENKDYWAMAGLK